MTPEAIRASYKRAIDMVGEPVIFRRYTGTGQNRPSFDATVRARVIDYTAAELIGGIVQGDRRLIVLAEDLIAAQVPLNLRKGDRVVVRGKELNIEGVDDNTRRVNGVLIAFDLQVRG